MAENTEMIVKLKTNNTADRFLQKVTTFKTGKYRSRLRKDQKCASVQPPGRSIANGMLAFTETFLLQPLYISRPCSADLCAASRFCSVAITVFRFLLQLVGRLFIYRLPVLIGWQLHTLLLVSTILRLAVYLLMFLRFPQLSCKT